MVSGALAEVVGWWFVATRGRDVWRLMPSMLRAMGVAAVLARRPVAATDVADGTALAVGVGERRRRCTWPRGRSSRSPRGGSRSAGTWSRSTRRRPTVSLARSLVLSLAVMVPARGALLARAVPGAARPGHGRRPRRGAWTWLAYVAANAASASLPIVAGAVVGGALWAGLALWSGGVLASLASHMLWTGLMLALPPGAGRGVRAR